MWGGCSDKRDFEDKDVSDVSIHISSVELPYKINMKQVNKDDFVVFMRLLVLASV